MAKKRGVFLFDEFDAVARHRHDGNELGEIKRVVSSFLQLLDADKSHGLIIAATNFAEAIDRAVVRRFDLVLEIPAPTTDQLESLISMRLANFDAVRPKVTNLARMAAGVSFADCARACDDAIRNMVLAGRDRMIWDDLKRAFSTLGNRGNVFGDRT